jgi:hypothetical protein
MRLHLSHYSIYIKNMLDYEELHSDVRLCKGIPYKKDDADTHFIEIHAEEETKC